MGAARYRGSVRLLKRVTNASTHETADTIMLRLSLPSIVRNDACPRCVDAGVLVGARSEPLSPKTKRIEPSAVVPVAAVAVVAVDGLGWWRDERELGPGTGTGAAGGGAGGADLQASPLWKRLE